MFSFGESNAFGKCVKNPKGTTILMTNVCNVWNCSNRVTGLY